MSRSTESQNEKDLFNSPFTFMGVPSSTIAEGSRAAILGIPFDCGTHPVRIGARYGPNAIREQSTLVRPFQPPHADFNPLEQLNLIDPKSPDRVSPALHGPLNPAFRSCCRPSQQV